MMRREGRLRHLILLAGLCALFGCGGEEGDTVGGGEVSPPWDAYCVATFSKDYAFVDGFDDVEFRVKQGGRYLMADFGPFGTEVLYLSGAGPVEFTIDFKDSAAPPFTSNCSEDTVEQLVGVFEDVTVYSDQDLTMPACMLKAGTALKGGGLSYALVSGELFAGGGTYEISFPGLADACDGLESGYVEADSAMVSNTEHTVLPIANVIGPPS